MAYDCQHSQFSTVHYMYMQRWYIWFMYHEITAGFWQGLIDKVNLTVIDTTHICDMHMWVNIQPSTVCAAETSKFFRALSQVGTDFTMMTLLIPRRSRKELKVIYMYLPTYTHGWTGAALYCYIQSKIDRGQILDKTTAKSYVVSNVGRNRIS